ncbi:MULTISPECIES: hypothetical protein [unclassified Cryobacterium]|uniref:hypothetical protein n=1 Tax=unclassified Cryobacterium TaxID=2649013 RepID=UPI002AB524E1|nr:MULTISPECIES: hypothetical protein [unclassified Cryobacterium]MDY7542133.1 hypothetical protein [Cryobacterium sp. 5B3]MEB0265863.1 hypothetical protein [Cryobacterium sp. 10I5]MEB0275950.1 hypothetical protein [Cryobacterium sp. 5B3]
MRIETVWREIEATWGLLNPEEVLKALNLPKTDVDVVSRMRADGQLLAIERGRAYAYPGFQFESGHVAPVVRALVVLAHEVRWTQNELIIWLCSPSGYFGGDRPVGHLNEADELVEKARDEATVEW